MGVLRYFFNSASQQNIAKGALAALRKKTGYTFANCRKALQLHDNDAVKVKREMILEVKIFFFFQYK